MNIRGIYKTSLIDYPGKISMVLFSGGCNLKCKYCHNPDFAENRENLESFTNNEVLNLLNERKNLIDGVTLSGGEPTLNHNIDDFIKDIKKMGLSIKLDTNGLKPDVVERLTSKKLLDYTAVDIKTSPDKYEDLTNTKIDFSKIVESINILKKSNSDYEIRTTCVPGFTGIDDFKVIKEFTGKVKRYYLQKFVSSIPLIDDSLKDLKPYSKNDINDFREFVQTFSETCDIRWV